MKEAKEDPKKPIDVEIMNVGERRRLLARDAGNVAIGLVSTPSPTLDSADKIASASVDVAEAILKRIGLG